MGQSRRSSPERFRQNFEDEMRDRMDAQDQMLGGLAQRLEKPVLNGGFDSLVAKVEKISLVSEQTQEAQAEAVKKIDAIHTVVLDPDTGLYHKVKSNSQWIDNVSKGMKWFLGLLIAGLLGGGGKLLYDFISSHIHLTP